MAFANAEQLRAGQERKRAAGGRAGGPAPYGWRWSRGDLVPVEQEQCILWLARHLVASGWSLQRVADELHSLGLAPRSGGNWRRDSIYRLVSPRAGSTPQQQNTG